MVITDRTYFESYSKLIGSQVAGLIAQFDFSEKSGGFEYLTKASAVYSSRLF